MWVLETFEQGFKCFRSFSTPKDNAHRCAGSFECLMHFAIKRIQMVCLIFVFAKTNLPSDLPTIYTKSIACMSVVCMCGILMDLKQKHIQRYEEEQRLYFL